MTNKKVIAVMLVLIPVFGLILSSCATNIATTKGTNFDKKPMELIGMPKYTVLGPVSYEKNWFGVLGFTIPSFTFPAIWPISQPYTSPMMDSYLYQSGGITYNEILEEAKRKYSDADAVIDIKIDYSGSTYASFFAQRTNIVSGIAIKYSRNEVDYPPANELRVINR